ncbi:MAG: NAD-dependent epimerase/dehydratase family protein, partial [Candidatus Binatia bacterium]
MKLIIAGGTGFIGSALCARLTGQGHSHILLIRSISAAADSPNTRTILWQPELSGAWEHILEEAIAGADGVINLTGEPIAGKRWSPAQKRKLRS